MGRIAYLTKRGAVWWYRRRYPVIVIHSSQNNQISVPCCDNGTSLQARGHMAVSLRTRSKREARILGAFISADFERAWAMIEAVMNEHEFDTDMMDAIAMTMAKHFRSLIEKIAHGPASSFPDGVKLRAYRILEQDLRKALGVEGKVIIADAQPTPQVEESPEAEAMCQAERDALAHEEDRGDDYWAKCGELFDPENEPEHPRLAHIGEGARTNDDYYADYVVSDFGLHTHAFRATLSEYLDACERLNLDPSDANAAFPLALKEAMDAAQKIGMVPAPEPKSSPATAPRKNSNQKFADFADKYLALRCQGYTLAREDETADAATGRNFERTSLRNWQSSVRLFVEIVGDLPLCDIGKEEVIEFNDWLQRLPKNFGKSSKDKRTARQFIEDADEHDTIGINELIENLRREGKPPGEIEEAAAAARVVRLSATTMKRHQQALHAILAFAHESGAIDGNPFKGRTLTTSEIKRRKRSERRVERVGWGEDIYALLGSEIFQNELAEQDEPLFWCPLIAMYAGLRLEEILQLRVNDFYSDAGIMAVRVQNEIGSQEVKSENGFRSVPLHRALIDIGLPELVALRRQQGLSRLFPHIERSKSKGTLSAIMSKRFGYYTESRGIKKPGLDFHALRTEFHVRLARAKVPDHVRKGLMGHEQTDVTHKNYYRLGETIEALKEYVDLNDINHYGVRSPFGKTYHRAAPHLRVVNSANG
ncbi:MAG: hypothetical protein CML03_11530 [Pseudooceanicola sp.]|nr:hypothetical protein [Pseudooceanicola sp.]